MISTFDTCKLWPLSADDYKEHFENVRKAAESSSSPVDEFTEEEIDEELEAVYSFIGLDVSEGQKDQSRTVDPPTAGEAQTNVQLIDMVTGESSSDDEKDVSYEPNHKQRQKRNSQSPLVVHAKSSAAANNSNDVDMAVTNQKSTMKKTVSAASVGIRPIPVLSDLSLADCINNSPLLQEVIRSIAFDSISSQRTTEKRTEVTTVSRFDLDKTQSTSDESPASLSHQTARIAANRGHDHPNQTAQINDSSKQIIRDLLVVITDLQQKVCNNCSEALTSLTSTEKAAGDFNCDDEVEKMFELLTRQSNSKQELITKIIGQFLTPKRSHRRLSAETKSAVMSKLTNLLVSFYSD
jgi:hypothetical protein